MYLSLIENEWFVVVGLILMLMATWVSTLNANVEHNIAATERATVQSFTSHQSFCVIPALPYLC